MEKIAFYCRTSSSEQERQHTIETQLYKLKEIYNGKNVVKIYKDEGISGAYLQRPALGQLREDAKREMFNVLALYSLDRLSRDMGHQLFLRHELKDNGIKIEILGKSSGDNPQGEFSDNVLSAAAQYERQMIRQKMKDGIARRIDNNILIGTKPSFGYELVKRDRTKHTEARFEIKPEEVRIVREVFRIFNIEQNVRETARQMYGQHNIRFSPRKIARILRNETYIGNFYYNKKIYYHKENRNGELKITFKIRPRSEWKRIKDQKIVPPIIDKATFDRTQEMLAVRTKNYLTKTKYQYLCNGLVRCVHCGSFYGGQITGHVRGKHYFSYVCHKKKNADPGKKRCESKTVGSRRIEGEVWDYIKSLIKNPMKVKKAIRISEEERRNRKTDNQKIYDSLMVEKQKIERAKSKLLKSYAFENVKPEDIDAEVGELNNQEKMLDKEIEKVKINLQGIDKANETDKEIEKICLTYQEADLDNAPFEIKKMIVRKWVKEINITDNRDILLKVRVPVFDRIPFKTLNLMPSSIMSDYSTVHWVKKLAENP